MTLIFWTVMHITLWACLLFPPHRGHPQGEAPAQISSSVQRRLPPRTHTLEHSTLLLLPRHLHSRWFNPAPPTLWHHRIPHLSLNACNVRYLKLGCSKLGYTTTTMTTTQWSSTGQRLEGFWSGYGIREQLNWGTKGLGMWKGRMCRCLADWQIHNQPHAVKFCYSYWFCFCFLVCACKMIKLAQEMIKKSLENSLRGLSAAYVCILFVESLLLPPFNLNCFNRLTVI